MSGEKRPVGKITHFFGKINVAAIELTDTLKVGDTILIEGPHGSMEQPIDSMQVDNKNVSEAGAGAGVGIKVKEKVRVGDSVFVLG